MRQGLIRQSPALAVAVLALFVALGGSVYAAKRAKIDGKAIRVKSTPGNRLKPSSVPGNRLKPHSITARQLKQGAVPLISAKLPLTGAEINELTLGQVPSAAHADSADTAQSAVDAQTALNAVNAVNAQTVNGYSVGCLTGTEPFAGACWDNSAREAVNAPTAASKCAKEGGELPDALTLAAFGERPGIRLDSGDEWSGDVTNVAGLNAYSVVTVSTDSELNYLLWSNNRAYRCVFPLLNYHQ